MNQLSKEAEYILQSVKYNEFVKVSNIVLKEKIPVKKIKAALRELREKGHALKSEITKDKDLLQTVYIFEKEPNDFYKESYQKHLQHIKKIYQNAKDLRRQKNEIGDV